MGIQKINYIRRQPGLSEFNTIIDTINKLIDKVEAKLEVVDVKITRQIKDYRFFNGEEVTLPYHSDYLLASPDDAAQVFSRYTFTYQETKNINDLIIQGKIVALSIDVIELITERDKRQETIFQTVEDVEIKEPKKKEKTKNKKKSGRKNKEKSQAISSSKWK